MLHNLLPQDCRAAELLSAGSMLATAVYILAGSQSYQHILEYHPFQFWVAILTVLGCLQLIALAFHERLEVSQYLLALTNGSLWVWISTVEQDPAAFFIGFSNLYAFSVGFLFLKKSWQI